MSQSDFGSLLAKVLPSDVKITVRHISSTPTPCAALFASPPGESPEATFCENHFLTVSIGVRGSGNGNGNDNDHGKQGQEGKQEKEVIVFGLEALVYNTPHLTTIFVSKADSTGYLHLLQTARKVSLLRLVSTAFLSYLVETRQRAGVRLVLSLFARAQNQYLFPGSIDNPGKHVLDDRGLIKWWCRVVDPVLRERQPESVLSQSQDKGEFDQSVESTKNSATAYLIVPGCDRLETRGFFPSTARFGDDRDRPRWVNGYPLQQLCGKPNAPPRCLVPRLPDDPKTRFLSDLDEELPKRDLDAGDGPKENAGQWKSVKSLDGFWEMMAYRQECSAGRLVGFLWLVVNPPGLVNSNRMEEQSTNEAKRPCQAATAEQQGTTSSQAPGSSSDNNNCQPFSWPEAGRGHVVLGESDYGTAIDFLLQQEFDTYGSATASSKAWIDKVASLAERSCWGETVLGRGTVPVPESMTNHPETTNNLLNTGLVRKRKKPAGEEPNTAVGSTGDSQGQGQGQGQGQLSHAATVGIPEASQEGVSSQDSGVNVLSGSFIKKKKKT